MMSHERRHYLFQRIHAHPQVVDAFTVGNLICTLFENKDGDVKYSSWMGDWFLEAVQPEIDRLIARQDTFWSCRISPTMVSASHSTHVFETEGYSRWVEAVAINE